MSYLINVRHGKYNHKNGRLTPEGREEVFELAKGIYYIVKDTDVGIICSPKPRTTETGSIIADKLGIEGIVTEACLGVDYHKNENDMVVAIWDMFRKHEDKYDSLVLVTHAPIVRLFSWSLRATLFDKHELLSTPGTGSGYCIDLNNGRYEFIPK